MLAKAAGLRFSNDPFWHIAHFDEQATIVDDLLAGRRSIDEVVRRYPAYFSAQIIKDPNFSFIYPELEHRFPDSPRLFIVRDPRQNIRSILNRLRIDGRLEALGPQQERALDHARGWQAILAGDGLGISHGSHIARLAQRWNLAIERYWERRSSIRLVRYEDFLADKSGCIADLAEDLGLQVVRDIHDEQDRQFQPRGNRSVTPEQFFGRHNLALIESICAEGMARFGYEPSLAHA
ncbi:hypothetical protein [Fulvimonas yonginensis]|uniref:Sulfotransferase family protein n=1 Tax=Fulvimonas yonginensis TaxID=1495200 RepID=A0ABU8J943_9GAMM